MTTISTKPAAAQTARGSITRSEPCHVAHLQSTLGIYGAERWTLDLAKHLDRRKVETVFISVGTKPGSDALYHLLKAEGLPAFHIQVPGKLNPRAVLQLRRLLAQQRVDVLNTHGFKADVLGYLATRHSPVRLVSTVHGWCAAEGLHIRIYEAISRLVLKRFDRVYPVSPALLDDLQQRNFDPRRLHLISNGVDLSAVEYRFCKRHPADPFSLLFAGRICRPKGIFDLVQAFAQAKFRAEAKLTIVGDGPDRQHIAKLAQNLGVADKIRLMGAVPGIGPFLKESNGLVLPSYSEGIPRTVMEAFAAGVPVVGTAIPGIKILVKNEFTGMLVPVNDPTTLARALERLCANPGHAASMAKRARQLVVSKFSARRMATDYENEYRRLCETP